MRGAWAGVTPAEKMVFGCLCARVWGGGVEWGGQVAPELEALQARTVQLISGSTPQRCRYLRSMGLRGTLPPNGWQLPSTLDVLALRCGHVARVARLGCTAQDHPLPCIVGALAVRVLQALAPPQAALRAQELAAATWRLLNACTA